MKMKDKKPLSEFDYHEAMDRSAMLTDMVCKYLVDHPICKKEKEFSKKVKKAAFALAEAYQIIGHKSFEFTETVKP